MTERTQLILSSVRNYEFIKNAVDQINQNLYSSDLFENDRIQMEVQYSEDGTMDRFIVTGTALDFFQIGLRYGALEEMARAKKISDIINRY
jgi:membrane protein involved in colicin uptake